MQTKTQLVARRGELLAEAAEEQAKATRGGEQLGVSGLPATAVSTERAALSQAETYERWAVDAAQVDVLLGRAMLELARRLREVAGQATVVRAEAHDALASDDDEPPLG